MYCNQSHIFEFETSSSEMTPLPKTLFSNGWYYILDGKWHSFITGKSLSESLILASTNPQYDDRLNYKFSTWKLQGQNMMCTQIVFLFWHSEPFVYTTCSELGIFMYWTCNSVNNLLSYYGLVDARISASDKDLPVMALEGIGNFL